MPSPFTTPVAQSVPFEPNRVTPSWPTGTGIAADNVQDAIEEAKADALANDRFLVLAHYGGNASSGRYLEIFPAEASDIAPIYLTAPSNLLQFVIQTTAANATCTLGVFDLNVSSVTPVYTLSMSAQKRVSASGILATIPTNALVAIKVTSGSINSPIVQMTLSAST